MLANKFRHLACLKVKPVSFLQMSPQTYTRFKVQPFHSVYCARTASIDGVEREYHEITGHSKMVEEVFQSGRDDRRCGHDYGEPEVRTEAG